MPPLAATLSELHGWPPALTGILFCVTALLACLGAIAAARELAGPAARQPRDSAAASASPRRAGPPRMVRGSGRSGGA